MRAKGTTFLLIVLSGAACSLLGGCPETPEPASLLQGRWLLLSDAEENQDTRTFLTFNEDGRLQRVLIEFPEGELETAIVRAKSDVIGNAVEIDTNLLIGRIIFTGVFNSEFDEVIGDATIEYTLLGSALRLEGDPGRLIKVN